MRIQCEVGVTRDREVVDSEGVEGLTRLELRRRGALRAKLREAVGDKEDEDDEQAVGGALDLEVAEERVRAEEVEGLVNDVCRVRVRCTARMSGKISQVQDGSGDAPSGAGPRILVLMGRMERLPTWRTSGSSLYDEW